MSTPKMDLEYWEYSKYSMNGCYEEIFVEPDGKQRAERWDDKVRNKRIILISHK